MILTTTTETVQFSAPWRTDSEKPVFYLRAAGVIERSQMEAELSGVFRAGRVFGFELREAMRGGIVSLFSDDQSFEHLIGLVDAEGGGEVDSLADEDQRLLADVRTILAASWPPFRGLVEQLERRREISPIIALRRFCTHIEGMGIDGKPIAFARDRQGFVSEATLAQIDPLEMAVAGSRAYSLAYGEGAEKNLLPPSSSGDGRPISSSDEQSKADGALATTSGKKTPGSRSRRGSGRS